MSNLVLSLIEELYHYRHEIADIYAHGEISIGSDKQELTENLVDKQILGHTNSSNVRLLTHVRELLDKALRKHNIVALNTDMDTQLRALQVTFYQYREKANKGDLEGVERVKLEIRDRFYSIYDLLDMGAKQLQFKVQTSYGQVSSGTARKSENDYYLAQLDKLQSCYDLLSEEFESEVYGDISEAEKMAANINLRLLSFLDRLNSIRSVIRENIFQLRKLEERTKKIRALSQYMNEHPSATFDKTMAIAEQCYCFMVPQEEIKIRSFPNINSIKQEAWLRALVQNIQKTFVRESVKTKRQPSNKLQTKPPEKQDILDSANRLFMTFLKEVRNNPKQIHVAEHYFESMCIDYSDISKRFWLYFLMNKLLANVEIRKQPLSKLINFDLVLEKGLITRGNYELKSVRVTHVRNNELGDYNG